VVCVRLGGTTEELAEKLGFENLLKKRDCTKKGADFHRRI
jgi:hypothetical protein